jgi:agmatinase
MLRLAVLFTLAASALAHGHSQKTDEEAQQWMSKYGSSPDLSFSGITTFARLPCEFRVSCPPTHPLNASLPSDRRCLEEDNAIDIAVVGFPFDVRLSFPFLLDEADLSLHAVCRFVPTWSTLRTERYQAGK